MTNLGSIRGLEDTHQLEIAVDGERVLLAPVGSEQEYTDAVKNATDVVNLLEARLQARVFVKAGERPVGVAFLAKTATLGDTRLQNFERSTLIATDHRGLPHVESVTISGPFNPKGPGDTASRRAVFTCGLPSTTARGAGSVRPGRRENVREVDRLASRPARLPPSGDRGGSAPLMTFYDDGRREEGFEHGIERALRAILVSPKFLIRVERDPARAWRRVFRPGDPSRQRHRPGVAPLVLPVEQHPGRRAARSRREGAAVAAGRARRAGEAHAARPEVVGARGQLRGAVAARPQPAQRHARQGRLSRLRRQPAPGVRARAEAVRRRASSARTATSWT